MDELGLTAVTNLLSQHYSRELPLKNDDLSLLAGKRRVCEVALDFSHSLEKSA
jgi:hypothetical protein